MYLFCGVVIESESVQLDRIFTYALPESVRDTIKVGHRVKVPFGRGNKLVSAYVIELYEYVDGISNVKYIEGIQGMMPIITEKNLEIVKMMRDVYLSTYWEGIKLFIPPGTSKGTKHKKGYFVYTKKKPEGKYEKAPYTEIYDIVAENQGIYNKNQISKVFEVSLSSINTMIKNEFLEVKEEVISRHNTRIYKEYAPKVLTQAQQSAVDTVMNGNQNKFLLKGVTGSGKTEVYMALVQKMIDCGKGSVMLVPEIALTPQMVERFKGRFGDKVAIFHSKLSQGERFDEWMRVKNGEVPVAVGARSALFLPFDNLGLIVIDEEHESSYKSDSDPKYHAVDVALYKSEKEGCKVVLGSATPNVETYYKFKQNDWTIIELKERVDKSELPSVQIVDMREELKSGNRSVFSMPLYAEMEGALERHEQIILFLNRRGFSTFMSCRSCGYVFKCESCDISMTYHTYGNRLKCHYCGHAQALMQNCPQCSSRYIKQFGAGTEKIEQAASSAFPHARILRMDFDTTRKKGAHESIYNTFKNKEADILVGTQMIAKGLDFEDVTVVGVVAADLSLNLPDFRASERTFQLITQVAGRAGRGSKKGNVVVQTYAPDNFSIQCAKENDYEKFYKDEIQIRYLMNYPPFGRVMAINFSSPDEKMLISKVNDIGDVVKYYLKDFGGISVLGPSPSGISKIQNQYRWQIVLKGDIKSETAHQIKNIVYDALKGHYNNIKVGIDLNPYNIN